MRIGNGVPSVESVFQALALLRQADPKTLARIERCTGGILVTQALDTGARFDHQLRVIILNSSLVSHPPTQIAMAIAHETMHAWIGPHPAGHRVEQVCAAAELRAARRLAADPALIREVEWRRANIEAVYSPDVYRRRYLQNQPLWVRAAARWLAS